MINQIWTWKYGWIAGYYNVMTRLLVISDPVIDSLCYDSEKIEKEVPAISKGLVQDTKF